MVFLQCGRARLGPSELKRTCAVSPRLTLRGGTTFWGSVEKKFFRILAIFSKCAQLCGQKDVEILHRDRWAR